MMFRNIFLLTCVLSLSAVTANVPSRPSPPRLVNDYAELFTSGQKAYMEQMLVDFSDSTSNQIVVVTVNDLDGYDISDFAYQIGETWGVGNKKYNNGIVIVLKPRNETSGEVKISPGYGLEGAIPDATCKDIIENEMIPYLAEGQYYEGLLEGLSVIMPLAAGEITSDEYANSGNTPWAGILVTIFFVGLFVFIVSRKHPPGSSGTKGSTHRPFIYFPTGGRGFGGFGGFGGGSFGGGGASGKF
ncbi:MAG: TPM domain-containing protein [Bacteroidales bacterium]|jgi:uncharacterized protein|nr:TPM domain-containing protein [Bacteroidales bacterium]